MSEDRCAHGEEYSRTEVMKEASKDNCLQGRQCHRTEVSDDRNVQGKKSTDRGI